MANSADIVTRVGRTSTKYGKTRNILDIWLNITFPNEGISTGIETETKMLM
jgi:hypothetical protein